MNQLYIIWNMELIENKGAYKGDTQAYNDAYAWVENFQSTKNMDSWGLGDVEIEVEII